MKKHIIGFIIFSFIVGTSAFVAAFFYQTLKLDQSKDFDRSNAYVISESYSHSCWKSNGNYESKTTSAKVTQAVLDNKTQELKTELFVQSDEQSLNNIKVALHFFVKDGDSTRYLATEDLTNEKMDMKGIYDMSERRTTKATYLVTSSYDWLDDLKSRENLYVVPEIINPEMNRDYTPVFNEVNATPVTLAR